MANLAEMFDSLVPEYTGPRYPEISTLMMEVTAETSWSTADRLPRFMPKPRRRSKCSTEPGDPLCKCVAVVTERCIRPVGATRHRMRNQSELWT